jgi:hypothetical protein
MNPYGAAALAVFDLIMDDAVQDGRASTTLPGSWHGYLCRARE